MGLILDVVPGVAGLFGMGELFLGKRTRGRLFLGWSVCLYMTVFLSFFLPDVPVWRYLPFAWGAGYLLPLLDILYITRWSKPKPKAAATRTGGRPF